MHACMPAMGRPPFCDTTIGVKKGPWTPEEDIILVSYIQQHGPGNWRSVPENTGLMRCSKSCRLRWTNYLRPGIKRGNFTSHEEGIIIHLQSLLGNKWAAIASYLPQRTDNDIKNYWNTHLKKKVKRLQAQADTFQTTSSNTAPSSHATYSKPADHHHGLQAMQAMSCSNATNGFCQSNENISNLVHTWPAPASSQEVQDGATVACAGIAAGDEATAPEMTGKAPGREAEGPCSTFSLLEDWLLEEEAPPGQAVGDGAMEISAGCCADPIMF